MKKMIMALLLCVSAFAVTSQKKLIQVDQILSPYQVKLGMSYMNPTSDALKNYSFQGLTVSIGREFELEKKWSTTTEVSYTYGRETDEFSVQNGTQEIQTSTKLFKVNQNLNFNTQFNNMNLQPFGTIGLGIGRAKQDKKDIESTGNAMIVEIGAGVNSTLKNGLMPFAKVSYQFFNISEFESTKNGQTKTQKLSKANEMEYGGPSLAVGVGYNF